MELNELFKIYRVYLKWVNMNNNLIKARNKKRWKNHPYATTPLNLEEEIEQSLAGFLEWGAMKDE